MIAWFHKIAPPSVEKRMILVMDNLKYAVGGYFKAQFKIMGVVFLILFAGFLVLGIHYAVLVAFLISFLDFLPFRSPEEVLCHSLTYLRLQRSYYTFLPHLRKVLL